MSVIQRLYLLGKECNVVLCCVVLCAALQLYCSNTIVARTKQAHAHTDTHTLTLTRTCTRTYTQV